MQSKIIGSLVAAAGIAAVVVVFAIPVMPSAPAHVASPVTPSITVLAATQELNVRGVVESIDASARRIRVAGKDYAFSPDTVRISDKGGKLALSALKVGAKTQCVLVDDGTKQYVSEVWVES